MIISTNYLTYFIDILTEDKCQIFLDFRKGTWKMFLKIKVLEKIVRKKCKFNFFWLN